MRMLTICLLGLALLAVASTPAAAQQKGELALGFSNSDAPVGVRYFASDKVSLDLGLGLDATDLGSETATSFFLEFGVSYVLYDYQGAYFYVRPAVAYSSLDDRVYGTGEADATWSVFEPQLNLGAEVRLADHFGLNFQHGIRISITKLPDEILVEGQDDSYTDISTFGENVSRAGIWFTF